MFNKFIGFNFTFVWVWLTANATWFSSVSKMEDLVDLESRLISVIYKHVDSELHKLAETRQSTLKMLYRENWKIVKAKRAELKEMEQKGLHNPDYYQKEHKNLDQFTRSSTRQGFDDFYNFRVRHFESFKEQAEKFELVSNSTRSNQEFYLAHPLNQYQLITRVALEWRNIFKRIGIQVFEQALEQKLSYLPQFDDVTGAARELIMLQTLYQLSTKTFVQGDIQGFYARPLSMEECFVVGVNAYLNDRVDLCESWMKEAQLRKKGKEVPMFNCSGLLEMNLVQDRAELPTDLDASLQEIKLMDYLESLAKIGRRRVTMARYNRTAHRNFATAPEVYEELCRATNQHEPTAAQHYHLKCYYWSNGPYLTLSPVKMEEVSLSPSIVRFYDIVSNEEIDQIRARAKPKFMKTQIMPSAKSGTVGEVTSEFRTGEVAFLNDTGAVKRVNRRIAHITGLTITHDNSEWLQIVNYGIGGYYKPHIDAFERNHDMGKRGNRIATWLMYMSDVPAGGATIFPHYGIAVRPVKGSALFWYNLLPSGDVDARTLHAACPVLVGNKWIANKWVGEFGQEFGARKCQLHRSTDRPALGV